MRNLLFRFGAKHNVACQHSQHTRRRPNAGSMLAHHLRRWPSIETSTGSTPRVFWAACWSASGYCWRRVREPTSTVLGSIHSALVITSCWW